MPLEFEDSYNTSPQRNFNVQKPSKLVNLLLKIGLAKTESGANKILLAFAAALLGLSIIGIWYWSTTHSEVRVKYHFSNALVNKLPPKVQQQILK